MQRTLPRQFLIAACLMLAACGESEPAGDEMSRAEVAQAVDAIQLQPGEWEITSEIVSMESEGMPGDAAAQAAGQTTRVTQCLTPRDAANPGADFIAGRQDGNCTYRDFTMDGGDISGTMECSGGMVGGEMEMALDGSFEPDSYDLDMDARMGAMGMRMAMEIRVSGRRLGECPAA